MGINRANAPINILSRELDNFRHVKNNGTPVTLTENIKISHKTEFQ